ncbi:MAG: hypothetical protein ACD_45C00147G0002 [uncultured bacterium]|nr:MAG: hypothetical protein ACD_45C00147G0002 [uncultured bacterium]
MLALNNRINAFIVCIFTPENPRARLFIFNAKVNRTILSANNSPVPAACDKTMRRCKSSRLAVGIIVFASAPNPVLTP